MAFAFQWLRSLVFVVQIYLAMAVLGIVFAPWALMSPRGQRRHASCIAAGFCGRHRGWLASGAKCAARSQRAR